MFKWFKKLFTKKKCCTCECQACMDCKHKRPKEDNPKSLSAMVKRKQTKKVLLNPMGFNEPTPEATLQKVWYRCDNCDAIWMNTELVTVCINGYKRYDYCTRCTPLPEDGHYDEKTKTFYTKK